MSLAATGTLPDHFIQGTLAQHARHTEQQLAALAGNLREPLRALEDCSQTLRRRHGSRLSEEGQRMLSTVSDELSRTSRLLDGLLTYSAVASQPIACVSLDVTAIARSVFDSLSRIAPRELLQFTLEPLPGAVGDQAMVRHVFFNLLSNAVKFTRGAPHPAIHITGIERDGCCEYSVRDNGVGFDSSQSGRLFSAFQRLNGPASREGTGLGLAIVERIVRRHGGRVWAHSVPGQGATFSFSLRRVR